MGGAGAQDPNDGPASVLFEQRGRPTIPHDSIFPKTEIR
jgi:hypothetical protein